MRKENKEELYWFTSIFSLIMAIVLMLAFKGESWNDWPFAAFVIFALYGLPAFFALVFIIVGFVMCMIEEFINWLIR